MEPCSYSTSGVRAEYWYERKCLRSGLNRYAPAAWLTAYR
jgi:hypothetical protein